MLDCIALCLYVGGVGSAVRDLCVVWCVLCALCVGGSNWTQQDIITKVIVNKGLFFTFNISKKLNGHKKGFSFRQSLWFLEGKSATNCGRVILH